MTRIYALVALLLIVSAIGLYIFQINRRLRITIFENERTKAALAQALTHVERAESEQRQLLSMASHEFRTPAAMIKASLDSLLILNDLIPPEVAQRLDNIRKASQRLIKLANSLISHDRLQERALKPLKQMIDLGQLVRDVINTYPSSDAVKVELPAHPVSLHADAALLDIALHNLLNNALRYHDALGLPICISIKEGHDNASRWLELRVADQGTGVADDEKEKIFQRFYSTKGGDSDGLGLSIVQTIAQAHDGTACVMDNLPQGAVFVITLPIP